MYGRSFGDLSNWTVQINGDSWSIWIYVHSYVHNRQFGLQPFGGPWTIDLDASKYTNMYRPLGRNLALTLCIWTTLERIIGWSKFTLNDRQNGRSCDVQLDGPNIRSLTVQMDDGPMDRPNGQRSNGQSKWTVHVTSIWTVQMDNCPTDRLCYVNLDRPKLRSLPVILDHKTIRLLTVILDRPK